MSHHEEFGLYPEGTGESFRLFNGQLQEVAGIDSEFSFGHTELGVYPSRGMSAIPPFP